MAELNQRWRSLCVLTERLPGYPYSLRAGSPVRAMVLPHRLCERSFRAKKRDVRSIAKDSPALRQGLTNRGLAVARETSNVCVHP